MVVQQLAVLLMQQGVYAKAEPLLDESAMHCHRQLGRHHGHGGRVVPPA